MKPFKKIIEGTVSFLQENEGDETMLVDYGFGNAPHLDGLFVTLHSHDMFKEHLEAEELDGKNVRITIEVIPEVKVNAQELLKGKV